MIVRVLRYIIMAILALVMTDGMKAQTTAGIDPGVVPTDMQNISDTIESAEEHIRLTYRMDGYSVDSAYRENSEAIARLRVILKNMRQTDSIVINSLASPDGSLAYNMRLSRKRGESARKLLVETARQQGIELDENRIVVNAIGANWQEMQRVIVEMYNGDDREKLLEIIGSDRTRLQKRAMLKRLNVDAWRFVHSNVVPLLRSSEIVVKRHTDSTVRDTQQAHGIQKCLEKYSADIMKTLDSADVAKQEARRNERISKIKAASALPSSVMRTHHHFRFTYRVDESDFDSTYMSNRQEAHRLQVMLHNAGTIDSINVFSFASPEGPYRHNVDLSHRRGETTKGVLGKIAGKAGFDLDENKIRLSARGENWDDMKQVIERKYRGRRRRKLLEILESDNSTEQKKRQIKRLGRKTWRFVADSVMPILRSSEIVLYYPYDIRKSHVDVAYKNLPVELFDRSKAGLMAAAHDSTYEKTAARYMGRVESKTRVALKTNMLYDAVMWTNFSVEVPFKLWNKNFSVAYDHQFPWWRWGEENNKYCNRYLQIGGEARWWFAPQKKPRTKKNILRECLAGHYVGVYGMGGKYDFEWGRDICYQGEFWSFGLSYGYSMPISKRLNLEFSISLGYASIAYRHFIPSDDYDILFRDPDKMGVMDYFGVTKLGVTLVVPINFKHKVKNRAL